MKPPMDRPCQRRYSFEGLDHHGQTRRKEISKQTVDELDVLTIEVLKR